MMQPFFFNHRLDQLRLSRQQRRQGCIFSSEGGGGSIATATTGCNLSVKRAARHGANVTEEG